MAGSNPPQKKTPIDYILDSESSDKELNQHLHTSQEERLYDSIKGSAQATQAALAYTMAQCNPTVERGPDRKPKIKPLSNEKAEDKTTQTQGKDKDIVQTSPPVEELLFALMTRPILICQSEESPLLTSLSSQEILAPQQDRASAKSELLTPQEPSTSTTDQHPISETLIHQVEPDMRMTPSENQ